MIGLVSQFMQEHSLVPVGSRVLVAVSGGPDSMCLLDILARLREDFDFDLTCATVDHGLRSEAGQEASLVEDQARLRRVSWRLLGGDAGEIARTRGGGLEEAARVLRFGLLEEEARRIGADRVALGHTLDDQAETVLIRLARGTGLEGLGGMRPIRDGLWIRPLLSMRREEVRAHLDDHTIPFAEDPSNRDRRFLRNRIRLDVLPHLEEAQPGAAVRIAALADEARGEFHALRSLVKDEVRRAGREHRGTWVLDRWVLAAMDPEFASLVVRDVIGRVLGNKRRISRRHVRAVLELCGSREGTATVELPRGIRVVRSYDEVRIDRDPGLPVRDEPPVGPSVDVEGAGRFRFGEMEIEIAPSGNLSRSLFPARLRTRMPGDRLLGRTRKLGRLLIDRKVPRPLRDSVPLLVNDEGVLWAGGLWTARGVDLEIFMHSRKPSPWLEWLKQRCR